MEGITKSVTVGAARLVSRWRVEVIAGESKGLVKRFGEQVVRVGSSADNDIVLTDAKVSRHHAFLELSETGVRLRDAGSKNGTFYQGVRLEDVALPPVGAFITLGDTELAIVPDDEPTDIAPSPNERCGRLVGRSVAMRTLFARIERIAPSAVTVLIQGETGTGKELVAEAIHQHSIRKDRPFVVVDCGAIARELIESELFGHVRGAFTGADANRKGAFELADGGTIFLDEIGELPLDLQSRLLRVLERGQVRPVGGDRMVPCDVRVLAASLRDLALEVREERFRKDLYYRLSVVRLAVPPLREHMEDMPLLVDQLLRAVRDRSEKVGASPSLPSISVGPESMRVLTNCRWPGNVRQLRNVLERASALSDGRTITIRAEDLDLPELLTPNASLMQLPYKLAKDQVVGDFTKEYLEALLSRHRGNISAAAREAEVDRKWLFALARRYGVRDPE